MGTSLGLYTRGRSSMANEKRVLVRFGERSRPVTFTSGSDSGSDADLLLKEVQKTFSDQMGRRVEENEFFLQVKDEDWAGEFVDVAATQAIPDKSVVKVLRKEKVKLAVSMYEASKT